MERNTRRIAILGLNYAPELTGIAPYTTSLANGLRVRGHEVRVITAHPHYPDWTFHAGYGGWKRTSFENGVRIDRKLHYVPQRPTAWRRLFSEITFGFRLLFSRWGTPDIVILVSPALFSSAIAAMRAKLGWNRPLVTVWAQDFYSLGIVETRQGGALAASAMALIESSVLRCADGVAVIHDRFKDYVVRRLRVDEQRVEVIRNWSHLPATPPIDRVATRQRMGWADDEIIVLHAGNIGVKQGLSNVVDAARIAAERDVRVRFVLMGRGSQRSLLEDLGQGISHLQFVAPQPEDEFQAVLGSADVLLVNELPGVTEMAVPSKLTSYFSTGLPVIAATDEGSVTAGEILAAGAGVRVIAGAPNLLVDAALALGQDPELARRFGQSAMDFRENFLSQNAAIDRYDQWLSGLAATRGSAHRHSSHLPLTEGTV